MATCPYCNKSAGLFKKVHKECELKNQQETELKKQAIELINQKCKAFFDNAEILNINEINSIAEKSFITTSELEDIFVNLYSDTLDQFLEDGLLSKAEEDILEKFMDELNLSSDTINKNGALTKTALAGIIRELLNQEEITNRINIIGDLPFKLQKNERLIYLFQNVELLEERIKTTYEGGSQGISVKIAKGLYYRTNSFKGRPIKTAHVIPLAEGMVGFTNKHLYFSSRLNSFRINYDKIITLDQYSDGIGVRKDGVSTKTQIFKNIDGWFCYNFMKNINLSD